MPRPTAQPGPPRGAQVILKSLKGFTQETKSLYEAQWKENLEQKIGPPRDAQVILASLGSSDFDVLMRLYKEQKVFTKHKYSCIQSKKLKQIDKALQFLAQRTKALRTQALTALTSSFGLI